MKFRIGISKPTILIIAVCLAVFAYLKNDARTCFAYQHADHTRKPIPDADALKKLPPDGGPDYNRLVFEKSPYLLQHAANPVNWYPWGEAAFEKARNEDKAIFLSIGYSTCHWCHVMEVESFEDEEVAKLMNEHFVCIKVDREERPDVDIIYMSAAQAMGKRGGWPLTIIMTAERKPFFAGTYFPKEGRFGRPGMLELIPRIGNAWKTRRAEFLSRADRITAFLQSSNRGSAGKELGVAELDRAYQQLATSFDSARGGFRRAPKFPTPHNLSFLLRYWKRSGNDQALAMVEKTLQAMRKGGMYDHVGFGFHRYSTDAAWLVPHFEKMLYDQAMLVIAYVEAFQATGKAEYADTAREILTYVLRDMTSPEGGFYSAEDADSEGVEGKFYLWTHDEIKQILGEDDAKLFITVFNIKPAGNFRNPHTPPRTNIPHLIRPPAEYAGEFEISEDELRSRLEAARKKLFDVREKRIHAYKDDKILTDWNGLMIAALAKAAQALDEPKYGEAAQRAADFILSRVRDGRGRLLKRFRDDQAGLPAHVEDYAFFTWGLLELYETNFEIRNLQSAIKLNDDLLAHFWDDTNGGFFFTADDGESLLVRSKEIYDGAIPSGNSVAMLNLIRIGRTTGDARLESRAAAVGQAFSAKVSGNPSAHSQLMCALDFGVGPSHEIVIAGRAGGNDTAQMLRALRRTFVPNKIVLLRPSGAEAPPITQIAEFTRNQKSVEGKATAYVCLNYACKLPTTDAAQMLALLTGEP